MSHTLSPALPLLESHAHPDPIEQFRLWFDEALAGQFVEPTAMALATADARGQPSVRMVLLKAFDLRGFVFFTNYASRKGEDLAGNPRASLLLWWDKLQRQIRIEGAVEKVPVEESDEYFHSRLRASQLSALASPQSRVVPNREFLEHRVHDLTQQYHGSEVPLPPHWGGYRVQPEHIEFWQGRRDRLHDRLSYRREADGRWRLERLAP